MLVCGIWNQPRDVLLTGIMRLVFPEGGTHDCRLPELASVLHDAITGRHVLFDSSIQSKRFVCYEIVKAWKKKKCRVNLFSLLVMHWLLIKCSLKIINCGLNVFTKIYFYIAWLRTSKLSICFSSQIWYKINKRDDTAIIEIPKMTKCIILKFGNGSGFGEVNGHASR